MRTINITRRRLLGLSVSSVAAGALMAGYAGTALAQAAGQPLTLYVFRGEQGITGPDGKNHDAFVPSSFVVKAGEPVQLSVINYDEGPHTITQLDLGLNISINPGNPQGDDVLPVTTNATFTVPKAGVYRWFCAQPCDGGGGNWDMTADYAGMGQDGYMAGNIVAI